MKHTQRFLQRFLMGAGFLVAVALWLVSEPTLVQGYVEVPHSLGQIVNLSSNIVLMQVESIDREKNLIVYRKVRDLKGKHNQEVIKHNIGRAGFHEREWKITMAWAEVGKSAIFFHNGSASETCIGNYWYQAYPGGEWWSHSHAEPYLLRSFAGRIDKLASAVTEMLENKEVIVPCMVGENMEMQLQKAKIHRVRASLKLNDYNPKRDFVGWGGEDFRRVSGMPGFTHISGIARVDPDAQSISCMDLDGDGKLDLCLAGAGRIAILQNGGEALSEISVPGANGGRSAVWADYNADGLPDLLLTTPGGPKLYTNQGKGVFRDDSHLLPRQSGWNLTSAAWIDQNADGRPDILLGNGYHGLRLFRNEGPTAPGKLSFSMGGWQTIGPFSWADGKGFTTAYPPEQEIDLKKTYKGRGGRDVAWQEGKFIDGEVNLFNGLYPEGTEPAVIYLYREIESDQPRELPCGFGSDDTLTVWCNGERLINENAGRAAGPDQNLATLKLKPGKNKLLIKICNTGGDWGYYFKAKANVPPAVLWTFADASDASGLGTSGLGSAAKGDTLTVFDYDGDGRQDFLYGSGSGVLVRSTAKGFVAVENSGIAYKPGRVGPVPCDFNGDGSMDLLVPQGTGVKLFQNDGKGTFTDVAEKMGLGKLGVNVLSAAWGDVDNDGRADLVLGCLGAPNRFLRQKEDGTFEDASEAIGLHQRVFNSQAVCLADLNNDGMLDLIFNNEGQESVILLGNLEFAQTSKKVPVSLTIGGKTGVTGSTVRLLDKEGKVVGVTQVSGGDGRGGQVSPVARFAVAPGAYKVEVVASNGEKRDKALQVATTPMRSVVE